MSRAQVTAEYLLISLIGLAMVSVSVAALSQIKESGEASFEAALFEESADSLAKEIDTVCALGNYNSRSIYIKSRIDVFGGTANGKNYIIISRENGAGEIAKETLCPVKDRQGIYGKIKVMNDYGEIALEG